MRTKQLIITLIVFYTAATIYAQESIQFSMAQSIPDTNGNDIALADFNNDGHLDAFIVNGIWNKSLPSKLWLNDGHGKFSDSGQEIGNAISWSVDAGDINGDGFKDVLIANGEWHSGGLSQIWINNGKGIFSPSNHKFKIANTSCAALGDLNGGGFLDVFFTNHPYSSGEGGEDEIWFNDGKGRFTDSNQKLGGSDRGRRVKLADVNGDHLLDAIVLNGGGEKNKIWLNGGDGKFYLSEINIGMDENIDFAIGDIDKDDDKDIIIVKGAWGKTPKGIEVWLNDGKGYFSKTQSIGKYDGYGIALGDLNGDDFLDVVVVNGPDQPNQVLLNDGKEYFFDSKSKIDKGGNKVAVGDINHDDLVDIIIVGNEDTKVFLQTRKE